MAVPPGFALFSLLTNYYKPVSYTHLVGASDGSVNGLVANDFSIFKKLFDYDFKPIESALGIDCFTQISNYKAIVKKALMYNHNVSEKVRALSKKLEAAKDEQEFFDVVTGLSLIHI